jgi:hypothetical protein
MAEDKVAQQGANVKPDAEGAHDRVAMLSLKADGTPDQYAPEIIGDKDFAVASAKRQFAEQAVSAVDQAERGVSTSDAETVKQDPSIEALQKKHDAAQSSAEKRAESVVGSLYKD